jgi:hypothetical protein
MGLWSRDLCGSQRLFLGEDCGELDLAIRASSMTSRVLTTCEAQSVDDGA